MLPQQIVTGRVANCLPLGSDGKFFLIGVSLYTHGNVWGIADPPEDWSIVAQGDPVAARAKPAPKTPQLTVQKKAWPYNLFEEDGEAHPGRK